MIANAISNKTNIPYSVAVAVSNSPRVEVWDVPRFSYSQTTVAWGTKYSNPGTLPAATGRGVAWNSQNTVLVVATVSTPFVRAYPWANGFGTAFANPGTLPVGACQAAAFNYNAAEQVVILYSSVTPFAQAYQFSSTTGWGTKYSNPASNPQAAASTVGIPRRCEFSSDDLGAAFYTYNDGNGGSGATIYAWSYSSGFGTRYQPTTNPVSGTESGVSHISYTNQTFYTTSYGSPWVRAYPYTSPGTVGTVYSNPSTLPPRRRMSADTSQDGKLVFLVGSASPTSGEAPMQEFYNFTDGTGWGTKFSDVFNTTYGGGVFSYSANMSPDKSFGVAALNDTFDRIWMWQSYSTTGYPQQTFSSYTQEVQVTPTGDNGDCRVTRR